MLNPVFLLGFIPFLHSSTALLFRFSVFLPHGIMIKITLNNFSRVILDLPYYFSKKKKLDLPPICDFVVNLHMMYLSTILIMQSCVSNNECGPLESGAFCLSS